MEIIARFQVPSEKQVTVLAGLPCIIIGEIHAK